MAGRALVLLSGGLDSATCLYWAKEKFSEVLAITFNYSGRIEREKRATSKLADSAGVSKLIEVDVPFVMEAADYFQGKKRQMDGRLGSYIPARNLMFYSIAAYHAEFLGAKAIIGGHNQHDAEFFRDASKKYMDGMNGLFRSGCLLCNGSAYRIILPLASKTRVQVIRLAIKLKVPIELTWSCHRDGGSHCGTCYACRQRMHAFSFLGIPDPAFAA